jgi:hypothetical protein
MGGVILKVPLTVMEYRGVAINVSINDFKAIKRYKGVMRH